MISSSLKAAALALLAGAHVGVSQFTDSCDASAVDGYDFEVMPEDGYEIRWTLNNDTKMIAIQMVTSSVAWAGIGFPSVDLDLVGSDVIIGLPDNSSVLEYEVLGETAEEVVVFEQQDITEASIVQADGSTTLSFIRPLSPGGNKQNISYVAGDATKLIFGQGADNELGVISDVTWSGMRVDLYCGTGGIAALARTPAPTVVGGGTGETPAPTLAPTAAAVAENGAADGETPAPTPADGDRGITTTDGETPSPSAEADGVPATEGPTTEAGGQGDSDGAFHAAAGAGWAAMAAAATGVATVLAALSL
ncbi:ferric reductase [Ectocarpus siliculosus]|uniref:Ferric reductase n=1 Tax=Ectocarpus siliculosus TaxID=2880 RepID=D7FJ77_ECTSI|nr:ferric reductase [Ectocarpus siliculosus]|eukprot:CBJ28987.1 ferric reductase [Ectocarpus siliculosus]